MKKKIITVLMVLTMTLITTCQLEVDEEQREVTLTDPYISRQPVSASYFTNETPAPLSIQVIDWIEEDGQLAYQWYTFIDIDAYLKGGSGTPIPGANSPSYTPTFNTAPGAKNYYYIVVTNTNPNVTLGADTGSVQSEVAVISFTAAGGALPPVISRHPGSADYQAGRAVGSLNVRAAARSDRTGALLSYQWYTKSIDADGVVIDEEVPNATASSFQPDPSELKFGKNYFFVEVTSTEESGAAAVEVSIPAVIEIKAGAQALAPTITVQPRDKMYFTGEAVEPLTVAGASRDSGAISYQWYENNGAVITEDSGTAVEGATAGAYTPAITTGTKYYYAVVTNFTSYVLEGGQTTATATSKLAKVSIAASGTKTANATVTVANPKVASNRYQYVRGYGGMDVAWANFPEQKPADMHTMYNPDTGLGYNINRIMISPGKVDPIEGVQDLLNAHRPNYYENVKIVNSYGGYTLASPWSPPKEWKSNNSINGGGHLLYAYRQQFADYLKRFAQNMYDNGAPIYAISISNEPNYTAGYDGCEWTPAEMRDFFKQVGHFTDGVRGFGGGKQIPVVLTVNGESANTPLINVAALVDPVSRAAIDLLCRHVYGSQTTTLWRVGPPPAGADLPGTVAYTSDTVNILDRGDTTKMEVWMTEHNINSANATAYPSDSTWNYVWRYMNDVDLVMRINNENAFVWWASKRFYSMIGDGQYGTIDGAVLPRGWGLSHYAKYTNDTHRVVADITGVTAAGVDITADGIGTNVNNRAFSLDNDSARITAYASITSGKDNAPIVPSADDVEFISMVMWTPTATNGSGGHDMGTVRIEMPVIAGQQFKIGSYTAIKSVSAASTHQPYEVTIELDRTAAYVDLGRGEMLSVKFIKGN